jgi:hypothetical protein
MGAKQKEERDRNGRMSKIPPCSMKIYGAAPQPRDMEKRQMNDGIFNEGRHESFQISL